MSAPVPAITVLSVYEECGCSADIETAGYSCLIVMMSLFRNPRRGEGQGRKIRAKDYDFRYDVKNQVKAALVDLELFLEAADTDD